MRQLLPSKAKAGGSLNDEAEKKDGQKPEASAEAAERNAELETHGRSGAENGLALRPYSYRLIRGTRSIGLVRVTETLAWRLRDGIVVIDWAIVR